MKKWNELSMAERVPYIKMALDSGITDLGLVSDRYNSYAKGGYLEWKRAIKAYKGIDIDNDPTYDYEGYYTSNPKSAWAMLDNDPEAHFTDEFKTALHPSFSDESRYSGTKNKYNPKGIRGGRWIDDTHYIMSHDMLNNNDYDVSRTREYLKRAESRPVTIYAPDGGVMLDEVVVTPRLSALNRSREATKPNTDFSGAQDMTPMQRWGANNLANWFGEHMLGIDPHTCLNTVTGFYNPKATVAANVNMVARPEDFGYESIEQKDAKPGDIIILSNKDNHPTHAVMFDSVSEGEGTHNGYPIHVGDTLVNYSNGGRGKNDYRLKGPLPRFDDPDYAGGDFSGVHRYYRYKGKKKK